MSPAAGAHELHEIGSRERFSTGEVQLENAQVARLLEDRDTVSGGEFLGAVLHFERVRTVNAMQRTTMRNFRDQGTGRVIHTCSRTPRSRRRARRVRVSFSILVPSSEGK